MSTALIPQTSFRPAAGYQCITLRVRDSFLAPTRVIYHVRYYSVMDRLDSAERCLYLASVNRRGINTAAAGFSERTRKSMRADMRKNAREAVGHALCALIALRAGFLC